MIEFTTAQAKGSQPYLPYLPDQNIGKDCDLRGMLLTEIRFVDAIEAEAPESMIFPTYDDWKAQMEAFSEATDKEAENKASLPTCLMWKRIYDKHTFLSPMLQGLVIMAVVALIILSTLLHGLANLSSVTTGMQQLVRHPEPY